MNRTDWLRLACLCGGLTALAAPSRARADGSADAAARALFAEGRKLAEAGQLEAACPKFEESYRLKPGIGTGFNLADCWAKSGRTASAWAKFLEVASAAANAAQPEREAVARSRAAELEKKLAYLTISVSDENPRTVVSRNGVELGRGAWGTAVPVDPGTQRIEATRPNATPFSISVEVGATSKEQVTVPALEPLTAPERPSAEPPEAPPKESRAAEARVTRESGVGTQRILGLTLGGLGVAGVALGTVFWLQRNSANEDAKGICVGSEARCPEFEKHAKLVSDAERKQTFGIVGFAGGAAALVTGAILYLTADSSPEESSLSVAPGTPETASGITLHGRW